MAQPSLSDVHVNVPLTNISIAYTQSQTNFIADKVFPRIAVENKSNLFYKYDRDAWFRNDAEERAPATETPGSGYTVTTGTYTARVYGVHKDIDDQIRANADPAFNLDREATEFVTNQLLIQRETIFINNFIATGKWTKDITGVAGTPSTNQVQQWDQPGSTPIEDVRTQSIGVATLTGRRPNTLILGPATANSLVNNPEIIDRVKYTEPALFANQDDYQILARAFGVDKVYVPYATQNTAQEGAALSMSLMYGKFAALVYAEPNPGPMTASGGYTFSWTNYLGGSSDIQIRKFRMEHIRADRVEGEIAFDMQLVAPDLGVYFTTVVS